MSISPQQLMLMHAPGGRHICIGSEVRRNLYSLMAYRNNANNHKYYVKKLYQVYNKAINGLYV